MAIISECTYQKFTLLKDKEIVRDLSSIGRANECEFKLPVFAYLSDTDDTYKNDFIAPILMLSNRYTNPEIYLELLVGCDWIEQTQLTDNTYGTYTTFNNVGWLGYKLLWWKVYNAYGLGCYRIRFEYTDITDASTKVEYSYKYDLRLYNSNLADKTTKLTYKINGGKIGNPNNDELIIDYGSDVWEREVRLPLSFFGFEKSEFTREYTRYKNGGQEWIQDDGIENYVFNCKKLPYSLHRELKITCLQADELYISDYNLGNVTTYDHKRVIPTSNYEPSWNLYNTYAPIQLTFSQFYQNHQRKRC